MKEIESQSPFVGKIVTCLTHNRSFQIEQGDEIKKEEKTGASKLGKFTYYCFSIKLPCGCTIKID